MILVDCHLENRKEIRYESVFIVIPHSAYHGCICCEKETSRFQICTLFERSRKKKTTTSASVMAVFMLPLQSESLTRS